MALGRAPARSAAAVPAGNAESEVR
jgi:hypothetical protein